MGIIFKKQTYPFRPWKPQLGRVFRRTFSFDCETTRIDEEHHWLTPAYVLGAAFNGKEGLFVRREDVAAFFEAHAGLAVVFHSAAFDLDVINTLAPGIDIYRWVEQNLVWDTQLLHRLYVLGTEGHVAGGKGESTLERCAKTYLKVALPKDTKDSRGDLIRLSYDKWLNRPPGEIEPVYLEYLAKDAIATRKVFKMLRQRLDELLSRSKRVWGFVSEEWLEEQIERWGPQTHHIQLRASIVLREISANGLHLDVGRREELAKGLEAKLAQQRKLLSEHGYLPGKGSKKALQGILKRLERDHPESTFPRTDTGLYSTSGEALQDLIEVSPFVRRLLEHGETAKLLNSFLKKMGKRVLHPSFNVLARTGRTSSFGEINAQNLPTDDRVRVRFVPSAGNVFIDLDYSTIELATLAQACVAQFSLKSKMARAINDGKDLHTLVAAQVKHKPEGEVTKDERKKAKPINFGKPGGMGNATMRTYAKASYGVCLSEAEVSALSDAWFALFPEMKDFLTDNVDTPLELARFLDLTPASHFEHTDDRRFANHPNNAGRQHRPHRILGCMCIKALKERAPKKQRGDRYSKADLDFFWSRLETKRSSLKVKFQRDVLDRRPSVPLQREVMSLVSRAPVFTLSGRLRAGTTYSARHNTIFQGLASDGAKLALWLLWRAGYRIVNFVHDQMLVEVPASSDLKAQAEKCSRLMIEGMKALVPDIHVGVKYAASDRWYKDAEAVFDKKGKKLLLWHPEKKEKAHA